MSRIYRKIKNQIKLYLFPFLFLTIGFFAGCLFAVFYIIESGASAIGKQELRYNNQHERATETIGRLETELERQRSINSQLAGEIRSKLQILEEFYANGDFSNGTH